jgi:hypothetical protein
MTLEVHINQADPWQLIAGAYLIKLFSFLLAVAKNKLDHLSPPIFSTLVYYMWGVR